MSINAKGVRNYAARGAKASYFAFFTLCTYPTCCQNGWIKDLLGIGTDGEEMSVVVHKLVNLLIIITSWCVIQSRSWKPEVYFITIHHIPLYFCKTVRKAMQRFRYKNYDIRNSAKLLDLVGSTRALFHFLLRTLFQFLPYYRMFYWLARQAVVALSLEQYSPTLTSTAVN